LPIFDLEQLARKRAFSKSQIGIHESKIANKTARQNLELEMSLYECTT